MPTRMTRAEYLESKWQQVLAEVKQVTEEENMPLENFEQKKVPSGIEIKTPDGRKVILYKAGAK